MPLKGTPEERAAYQRAWHERNRERRNRARMARYYADRTRHPLTAQRADPLNETIDALLSANEFDPEPIKWLAKAARYAEAVQTLLHVIRASAGWRKLPARRATLRETNGAACGAFYPDSCATETHGESKCLS